MELNQDQQKAFDSLVDYITGADTSHEMMLLDGPAGTGKSFTINRVVEYCSAIPGRKVRFGMTATTNKAVRVLKEASEHPELFQFGTIHSFCGLKQNINEQTGEVTYVADYETKYDPPITSVDVLIVDESSMLSQYIKGVLNTYRSKYRFKIIFTGDQAQLPPINEELSPVFIPMLQRKDKIGMCSLAEIVRQAKGNPIIGYATSIRTGVPFDRSSVEVGEEGIEWPEMNTEAVHALLSKYFDCDEFRENSNYAKVLAYRNKTVDMFNSRIREIVFKQKDLPKILETDCLIADKPIMKFGVDGWKVAISTNEEMRVEKVLDSNNVYGLEYRSFENSKMTFSNEDEIMSFGYDKLSEGNRRIVNAHDFMSPITLNVWQWIKKIVEFRSYKAIVEHYIDGKACKSMIDILHESEETRFKSIQDKMRQDIMKQSDKKLRGQMWVQFYEMQNHFAQTKYNYALSVHKSQGSSYQYAIVQEWDIDVNRDLKERSKLKYVAATRPRKKLFILNK